MWWTLSRYNVSFIFVILPFQIFQILCSGMFYLSGVKYKSIVTSTATVMHRDMISANFQFHFHQVLQTFLFSLIQTTITVQEGVLLFDGQKRISMIQDNWDHSWWSEGQWLNCFCEVYKVVKICTASDLIACCSPLFLITFCCEISSCRHNYLDTKLWQNKLGFIFLAMPWWLQR